jgi:hypothetical protein
MLRAGAHSRLYCGISLVLGESFLDSRRKQSFFQNENMQRADKAHLVFPGIPALKKRVGKDNEKEYVWKSTDSA